MSRGVNSKFLTLTENSFFASVGMGLGSKVGVGGSGVAVGGTEVGVGGSAVAVGGTLVAVGGAAVGGMAVAVAAAGAAVGGKLVGVAAVPQAESSTASKASPDKVRGIIHILLEQKTSAGIRCGALCTDC